MMQFVTITTAQALYAALGMSIFASVLAVVLTLMAYVHITRRWDGRGEEVIDYEYHMEFANPPVKNKVSQNCQRPGNDNG